jgi:hypothetical protein
MKKFYALELGAAFESIHVISLKLLSASVK